MADTTVGQWDELAARLGAVEGRVLELERAVGWWAQTTRGRAATATAPAARPVATPPPMPTTTTVEPLAATVGTDVGAPPSPGVPGPGWQPARVKVAKRPDLEGIIGRNWTSWVGAIVLVIGAIFFIQFAWEQGWLNPSPAARVMSAVGAGVALGVAGAWVNRRGMRVLAGTLTGAGIAIVMAACFAAHTAFAPPVLSSKLALAGVCAAAAVGIWRGVRINAVSVAIIALLGAYLAPAILRSGRDQSAALMTYLGALAVVGWMLAYLRPRWGVVRWFTLALTVLWMLAWVAGYPMRGEHRPLAMGAITFFLGGFLAEAFFSVHRAFRVRNERDESAVPGFASRVEDALGTVSLLATAAAFGGYYAVLRREVGAGGMFHLDPAAAVALGLAGVHGMIALATPSRIFARASVLAAAALLTVAVPLAFGRVAITLAWAVMAVALAALGWRRENRAVRAWCVVLLGLALARLFTFDLSDGSLRAERWHVGGQGVSPWLLLAWGMAIFAHVVGWLFLPAAVEGASGTQPTPPWAVMIPVAGTVVFFVASAMCWHGAALTALGVAWVAGLVAVAGPGARLGYAGHAAAACAVVAGKWLLVDGLRPIADAWARADGRRPVLNGVAITGALLIGLVGVLWRRDPRRREREILALVAAVLGFAWLNFETLRLVDYSAAGFADFITAKQVALSVLWGAVGLGAVVVGFARDLRPLRYAALGLLGVTLGKILFVDLAQVRPVYRILSFVAVGALLLCVSFVYHQHEESPGRAE